MSVWREPLLAWSLLSIIGCGLFATLHPVPILDLDAAASQGGQVVQAELIVGEGKRGAGWWRGDGFAVDGDVSLAVTWLWFDPADAAIMRGDRLVGRFEVETGERAIVLKAAGPAALVVAAGPFVVPVRWEDLIEAPDGYAGREVALRGALQDDALVAPGGASWCPVVSPPTQSATAQEVQWWVVVLVPDAAAPRWGCHVREPWSG